MLQSNKGHRLPNFFNQTRGVHVCTGEGIRTFAFQWTGFNSSWYAMQVKINLPLLEDIKDDIDFCCKLAKEESMIILPGEIILESIHQAFVTLVNNCHCEKKALLRQKILNFSFSSSRVKRLPFIHHSHMSFWIFLWKPPSVPPRNLGRNFSASPENTAPIYSCVCCLIYPHVLLMSL